MSFIMLSISKIIKLIILSQFYYMVQCFWPPSYTIDLHDEDTFEISDDFDMKMDKIVGDGDEMIPEHELSRFNFNKDPHKFVRLHQIVDGIEKRFENENGYTENRLNISEENFYQEYPEERNFSKMVHTFKDNQNVDYHNNMTKVLMNANLEEKRQLNEDEKKNKRYEDNSADKTVDYSYENMKSKFEDEIEQEMSTEIKYTEVKDYEGFQESLKALWKEKEEINCTIAEMRNLNGKGLLCLLKEPSTNRASKFFTRLGKIILIWLIVYTVIAVPLWCTRGWCCCCFRCKFCRPKGRIDWIKEYYMQNPVGIVHDDYGNIVEYTPTKYEKYYYKNLEKELKKLILH